MLELTWLVALAAGMMLWVRHDAREYRRFKALTDTQARQRYYRRWTVQSFVILTGASIVTLALLGRPVGFTGLPVELAPLGDLFPADDASGPQSSDTMAGMAVGMAIGLGLVAFLQWRRIRRLAMPVVGDIEPLMPRNGRERLLAIPLSLNAGFSEELFFRLALPLLIAQVTGSAVVGVVAATIAFGLSHAYQGWKGVVGTGFLGGLLMMQYLASGSLLRVMALHAALDLVSLIVRPMIADGIAARRRRLAPEPA